MPQPGACPSNLFMIYFALRELPGRSRPLLWVLGLPPCVDVVAHNHTGSVQRVDSEGNRHLEAVPARQHRAVLRVYRQGQSSLGMTAALASLFTSRPRERAHLLTTLSPPFPFRLFQILMEFCGGGAVNDLMASMPAKTFSEQQIAAIIAESLKGLVRGSSAF